MSNNIKELQEWFKLCAEHIKSPMADHKFFAANAVIQAEALFSIIAKLQAQVDAVMPYVGHQVDCSYTMFPETQGCDCGYLELVAIKGDG